jgi:hypothetical protein
MTRARTARLVAICGLGLGLSACAILPHGRAWLAFFPHKRPVMSVRAIPLSAPGPVVRADEGLYRDAASAIERRDYGLALDLLEAARDRDPRDPRILNAFGVVYDKLGRFDISADFYAQAEGLDPGSPILANNRAYSRMLQGKSASPDALAAAGPAHPAAPGPGKSCAGADGQDVCNVSGGTSW